MLLVIKSINSGVHFDLEKLDAEIEELTQKTESPDFWNSREEALSIISQLNSKKDLVDTYRGLITTLNDLSELLDLEDESIFDSIDESITQLKKDTKEFENQRLFSGEFDSLNAILEIHPGAGGTEAQDWADMLYRMYVLFAENHKYKMQIISFEPGDEAGIKSVTLKLIGKNAYGFLKGEKGVHRLVRISPFDANKRRHTSFASVNVIPEFLNNSINIEINDSDLKIQNHSSTCPEFRLLRPGP